MRNLFAGIILLGGAAAYATVPAGYYNSLDNRGGTSLEAAVKSLAEGHTVVSYNTKTWGSFEKTDVRLINGREVWWDMYSNNIVYLPEHAALNIEHSVASSWWGGKAGNVTAYSDLFHLNPSDQNANIKKGNNPPGEVADARLLDNGLTRIGTPKAGQGGGATSVFEPADEYKGDFARAYFYVFTAYSDAAWKSEYAYVYDSDGKLSPWAVELLLRWNREDPVDSKELNRNEAVYADQGNRNPFIDYPELAEYIWGDRKTETFSLSATAPAEAIDRPAAPGFEGRRLAGVNTYTGRWWDGTDIAVAGTDGRLMVSLDGGEYSENQEGRITLDPAGNGTENHVIRAYVEKDVNGYTLRSPISTLSMLARDPAATDYSGARWEKLTAADAVTPGSGPYLILSSNTLHAMSTTGGTTATAFMESAGFVTFDDEEMIIELPTDAAVVDFESLDGGKCRLMVRDIFGNYKGSWNATAKNKMKLDPVTYTPGKASMNSGDTFRFEFDSYGRLQFNASQPRFLNYETNQKPVYIYRFKDFNGIWSGVGSIECEHPWGIGVDAEGIEAGEGSRIYDLSGRLVSGRGLGRGVYIVVSPSGQSRKIALP